MFKKLILLFVCFFFWIVNGKAYTGFKEIDGNKYYFNEEGELQKGGIRNIDGTNYFLGINTGKVMKGWINYNGLTYHTDPETGEVSHLWTEIDGKTYFFGIKTFKLMKNWLFLDDLIYFLDPETGERYVGEQIISGRNYLFNNEGVLQGFKKVNNKLYYYNPGSSTPVKGIQRMVGKYYKFNSNTGAFEKYVYQRNVIDVSHHNGTIDWKTAWNTGKFDAVILRVGYGSRSLDREFYNNLRAMKNLGIPYSIYLFSYAENYNEAVSEANFVINTMRQNGVYPSLDVYLDLEYWYNSRNGHTSNNISSESYEVIVKTFVNLLKQSGYNAAVYASKNYALERFNEFTRPYVNWIAQYNTECNYPGSYVGWQYTSNGWIDGIGRVDFSYFYY